MASERISNLRRCGNRFFFISRAPRNCYWHGRSCKIQKPVSYLITFWFQILVEGHTPDAIPKRASAGLALASPKNRVKTGPAKYPINAKASEGKATHARSSAFIRAARASHLRSGSASCLRVRVGCGIELMYHTPSNLLHQERFGVASVANRTSNGLTPSSCITRSWRYPVIFSINSTGMSKI